MTRVTVAALVVSIGCTYIGAGCSSGESVDTTTSTAAASSAVTSTVEPSAAVSAAPTAEASPTTSSNGSGPARETPTADGPAAECAVGEEPMVFAYERASGVLRWANCTAQDLVPTVVGASQDLVFTLVTKADRSDVSQSAGRLVALESDTGAPRWSVDVGPLPIASAGTFSGAVLVVLAQGQSAVLGIDAADGSIRWRLDGMYQWPVVSAEGVVVVADPSVAQMTGGPVAVGPGGSLPPLMTGEGYVGVDRATGATLWSTTVSAPQELDGGGYPFGAIDGRIAVLGPGAAGLDVTTGAELWSAAVAPDGSATGYGGVAVFGGQEELSPR